MWETLKLGGQSVGKVSDVYLSVLKLILMSPAKLFSSLFQYKNNSSRFELGFFLYEFPISQLRSKRHQQLEESRVLTEGDLYHHYSDSFQSQTSFSFLAACWQHY